MIQQKQIIVSLTSVPARFQQSLPRAIESLQRQTLQCPILLNIPKHYDKWGSVADVPRFDGVTLYTPCKDYGPATKLLGALEYVRDHREISHVITVDDDIIYQKHHIAYLAGSAAVLRHVAITNGGEALIRYPFRSHDGVKYRNAFCFVDVPSGYRGVVYPLEHLRDSDLPFALSSNLPKGVFNNDDAYFGMMLSLLGIPLFALPWTPVNLSQMTGVASAVQDQAEDRIENKKKFFSLELRMAISDVAKTKRGRVSLRWST
jgi:hypothetical protein